MSHALRTRPTLRVGPIFIDVVVFEISDGCSALSNPNLQSNWDATMVSSDEIARALRVDGREGTVFGYLWLAVRKLVEKNVQYVSVLHVVYDILHTQPQDV